MKLKDIDFRVWNYTKKHYEEYPALAKMGSVIPAKSHHIRAKPFVAYDESGDELEVEFWTGLRDLDNAKIYEGDIVAHYAEGGGIEYYSKVVFNQGKGAFEFVCIEHPVIETFDKLANSDIGVVGNIHENKDL